MVTTDDTKIYVFGVDGPTADNLYEIGTVISPTPDPTSNTSHRSTNYSIDT